jgi:hypothetical protein
VGKVTDTLMSGGGERDSIILYEGSQASSTCPSDKCSVEMDRDGGILQSSEMLYGIQVLRFRKNVLSPSSGSTLMTSCPTNPNLKEATFLMEMRRSDYARNQTNPRND